MQRFHYHILIILRLPLPLGCFTTLDDGNIDEVSSSSMHHTTNQINKQMQVGYTHTDISNDYNQWKEP